MHGVVVAVVPRWDRKRHRHLTYWNVAVVQFHDAE